MADEPSPFHAGEREAQRRAGVRGIAAAARGFIRDRMPEQHRSFFAALPFLVVAAGDRDGRPWVSLLEGPEGFARSPDPRRLTLSTSLAAGDPLAEGLARGGPVGLLGIELATRRRNRLNGWLSATGDGYSLEVSQSFGNCPQYIREREWHRVEAGKAAPSRMSGGLDSAQAARIAAADTFFIGSAHDAEGDGAANGYDASHRGGPPGFVRVVDRGSLSFPDYPGNNFFNTIGNLLGDPRVGLLFVDFGSGGLLHVTGRARIEWEPAGSRDPGARRMIHVEIDRVVDRPGALLLRWRQRGTDRSLEVIGKVRESATITSFHLAATDGAPLGPFEAGQHLPIRLKVPGHAARVERSYSLSGDPAAPTYRISVKRESDGVASRFLHDEVEVGDVIEAGSPGGDFVLPPGQRPLVLVSAGVGITPMLSMLHAVVRTWPERPVWFVHGTRSRRHHAFAREVDDLIRRAPRAIAQVYFSAPEDGGGECGPHRSGRITAGDLIELAGHADAAYMLCGPTRFLDDLRTGLEAGGVPAERIHFETFGPAG